MKWITNKYLIAFIVLALIGIWMFPALNKKESKVAPVKENFTLPSFQVLVKEVKLQKMQPQIKLSGLVKSENNLIVRAQSSGKIKKNHITRGQLVAQDTLLIELDEKEFKTNLEQAKADFETQKINFETQKNLFEKELTSRVKLAEARANLKNATNTLNKAELDFNNRFIKSDFAGEVNEIYVKRGDFVNIGSALVEILDLKNIKVHAELLPDELIEIKKTNQAIDDFEVQIENPVDNNQQSIGAKLSFISKKANPQSRSYPIEIDIKESKEIFSLEQWVKINILLPDQLAYPIARSLIMVDSNGNFAVDVVNNQNQVETIQIEIIQDGVNQVWVTGLKDKQKIIVRGAGFVETGDSVSMVQN